MPGRFQPCFRPVHGPRGHPSPIIEDAIWSPDGSYLLIELYDRFDIYTADGTLLRSIPLQSGWYRPSGGWWGNGTGVIVTSDAPGATTVYDRDSAAPILGLPDGQRADWSDDGSVIVTVGEAPEEGAYVWDGGTGDLIVRLRVPTVSADVSPDGTRVLIHAGDAWEVWSIAEAVRLSRLDLPMPARGCGSRLRPEWSADSTMLRTAVTFAADTGAIIPQPEAFAPTGSYLEFTPDLTLALTWSYFPEAALWDVATGALLLTVPHHSVIDACSSSYWPPSLSPDGRYLVMWDSGRSWLDPYVDATGMVETGTGSGVTTVTLYAEPDADSAVVAELADDTPVRITESGGGGWWQIAESSSGQTGWLRNDGTTARLNATRSSEPYMQIWRIAR